MKSMAGLTKRDVMVVLGCVFFLMMSLGAVGSRGRRRAIRLVCASNLNLWYRAIKAQSDDNDGELLETTGYTGAGRYPGEMFLEADDALYPHAGMVYAGAFTPYLSGFNPDGLTWVDIMQLPPDSAELQGLRITGAWTCPSNKGENIADTISRIYDRGYLRVFYAYYARVDKWYQHATHPDDITGAELDDQKVLMADQIYYWGLWDWPCLYNHGLDGYSWDGFSDYMQLCAEEGPPKITGINKLFGDGRVIWKDRSEFDIDNMCLNQATNPMANPHVIGHAATVATFY